MHRTTITRDGVLRYARDHATEREARADAARLATFVARNGDTVACSREDDPSQHPSPWVARALAGTLPVRVSFGG